MLEISKGKYKKVNIYKLNNNNKLESREYSIKRFVQKGEDNGSEGGNSASPYITIEIYVNDLRFFKLYTNKYRRIEVNGWNLTGIFPQ